MSARRSVDGWLTTQDWAGVETCSAWRTGLSPAKAGSGHTTAGAGRRDTGHLAFGGDGVTGGVASEGNEPGVTPVRQAAGLHGPTGLVANPPAGAAPPGGGRSGGMLRAALICALVAVLLLIAMFRGDRVEFYEGPFQPPPGARP